MKPSRRDWMRAAGAGAACSLLPMPAGSAQPAPVHQVLVRAGSFLMGTTPQQADALAAAFGYHRSWLDGEVPQRTVWLPTYLIDRFPVTNQRYALFCAATGYPPPLHWPGGVPPANELDHPVTYVDRFDAQAYADWAGQRLPTEAEWEKAARGENGLAFPWGNVFDPSACRWNAGPTSPGAGTAPVAAHPLGASPYGVLDLVGNVSEWCSDGIGPGIAVVKGGCWTDGEILNLRCAARNMSGGTDHLSPRRGFRCVQEVA